MQALSIIYFICTIFCTTDIMKEKEVRFYDLSPKISSNLVVFPGDPSYSWEEVSSLNKGQSVNLSHMYIDFPAHTIKNHKTSSDYPINYLVAPGVIIEVPSSEKMCLIWMDCQQELWPSHGVAQPV